MLSWTDVSVLHSTEGCTARRCVFVPDLKILSLFLRFFFLLLLSLAGYENFFIVWRPEGRPVFVKVVFLGKTALT